MSIIIEDGRGSGRKALVDVDNRLATFAVARDEVDHVAITEGGTFVWYATATTAGASSVFLLTNNDPTYSLVIEEAELSSSVAGLVATVATGGTYASGGTATVGSNVNLSSGRVALATAYYGNALSVTAPTTRWSQYCPQYINVELIDRPQLLYLGNNQSMSLAVSAAATVYIHVTGWYIHKTT